MTSNQIVFQICSTMVLPQWLLMIFVPRWHITKWLVRSKLIPVLLAIIYVFYIGQLFSVGSLQSFNSLEGVKSLFSHDGLLLAGWIHYLAFDLFIGGWEWQNAQTRHIPHYWLVPSLIFTFLFGPVGLLLYVTVRVFYPPQIQAVL
jgi:hypothetical protein